MSQQELEQGDLEVMGVVNGHSHPEAAAAAEEIAADVTPHQSAGADSFSSRRSQVERISPLPSVEMTEGEGLGKRISPRAALGRNDTEGESCGCKCAPMPEWEGDLREVEACFRRKKRKEVAICAVFCLLVAAALVAVYYIPDILVWIVNLGVLSCGVVAAVKLDRWWRIWGGGSK